MKHTKEMIKIHKMRSPCPIANTLDILGDKWTLLIIRDAFTGKSTYGNFQASPENIPTNILADRLKRLLDYGILEKKPYQQRPVRYVYQLTDKGRLLGPILKEIINQIDMLLGLCSPTDPSYSQVVVEKFPYLTPDEQRRLHESFRHPNVLDELLALSDHVEEEWFQRHTAAFLEVCVAHGRAAEHHHEELVVRFIQRPAERIPEEHLAGITASGPPLDVLLRALRGLVDRRLAADRDDIPTRHDDIAALRGLLS